MLVVVYILINCKVKKLKCNTLLIIIRTSMNACTTTRGKKILSTITTTIAAMVLVSFIVVYMLLQCSAVHNVNLKI